MIVLQKQLDQDGLGHHQHATDVCCLRSNLTTASSALQGNIQAAGAWRPEVGVQQRSAALNDTSN